MTARAVLQAAQLDGVNLFLDAAGVLKISGNTEAVKKHADIIRAQKSELLDLLSNTPCWFWHINYADGRDMEITSSPRCFAQVLLDHPDGIAYTHHPNSG